MIYGRTSHMPLWRKRLHIESFLLKAPRLFLRMPRQFVGFKVLHDQFDAYGVELSTIVNDLAVRRIICLYRHDLLETFVSLKIAEANDCWYSTNEVNAMSVDVDESEFAEFCTDHRRMWVQGASQIPADCDIHLLSYESLVEDPAGEMKRVFEFIGPRYNRWPSPKSVRQNPAPIADKVNNYTSLMSGDASLSDLRFFELPGFLKQKQATTVGSNAAGLDSHQRDFSAT